MSYVAAVVAWVLPVAGSWAGVVATNNAVPYPQLVQPQGTAEDPTIFLYDGYQRNFDLVGQGLDIGTYYPYIALHIINQSMIRSTRIWFLGGDYPNKVDESGNTDAYPGHQTMLLDNSVMSTGQFRVGSKSSHNTLIIRNQATMSVGNGLYIDQWDYESDNTVIVTGAGTSLSVTNGALFVGYGISSNESLSVLQGARVTVGTATIAQHLLVRYAHDSRVTVSGAGSTLRVFGRLTLGSHTTHCYNNRLTVEDGGLVKIDGTLNNAYNTSKTPNSIRLTNGGTLALKGTYTSNTLSTLLAAGESDVYTVGPGVGDLAGYTVWKAAVAPKPKVTLLLLSGGSDTTRWKTIR